MKIATLCALGIYTYSNRPSEEEVDGFWKDLETEYS